MLQVIEFAMGPLFRFALSLMILGLLRLTIKTIQDIRRALQNAGDKNIPYLSVIKTTLEWMIPSKNTVNTQVLFSIISFSFHIGLFVVPIFLLEHILLWRKVLGFSWLAVEENFADVLTILTIINGLILLGYRIFNRARRSLSSIQDYVFLILIISIFTSGYLVSRPFNPLGYESAMLIHVICGNTVLLLIPFTRLSHGILFPLLRLASTIAWHFPPNAGKELNKVLYGEENRKI